LPEPSPFRAAADGLTATLRVAPKAARNAVAGLAAEPDGGVALRVSVTAAPEDGRANAAVVALLAKEWRLAKSRIAVVAGATDRRKRIHIAGDPGELLNSLTAWLAGLR